MTFGFVHLGVVGTMVLTLPLVAQRSQVAAETVAVQQTAHADVSSLDAMLSRKVTLDARNISLRDAIDRVARASGVRIH